VSSSETGSDDTDTFESDECVYEFDSDDDENNDGMI
jgi:hypothetical protein